ncbi:S-adenosyl-L-methionine-dependent methyltransferase [Tilletiaria anomala UBC 951]|uniref:type I protein arginine methyltransferase n=1 Tax=Tilletiaria anomala (strain ATCC 24038 / CBS 436.72 / UBC 951) TaxID=1037660 RepID=A0A066VIU0_TILAU|nr:S-adenosyl-L-methionine-dependent methyltransferase [Tilletiaria anomala UBC 951]KDN41662.1 S-adenosyl-L-methionine-dependent methyltransferase [Tilletiaria anomala UBC 951]
MTDGAKNENSCPEVTRYERHTRLQEAAPKDSKFEPKDTAYFSYYSLLSHQAQMLQDTTRTSVYQRAILSNAEDFFNGRIVMDVGAGNGILSLFSAQAGASAVYAVEASNMAQRLQTLLNAAKIPSTEEQKRDGLVCAQSGQIAIDMDGPRKPSNTWLKGRVKVVHSKMEDVTPELLDGNEKVDTIVSECLGVLLIHERMCESFIDARDRFLKPGGAMFPSAGTICLCPIEDKQLWVDTSKKAQWWCNEDFYGLDLTPLADAAWEETFAAAIVGYFAPSVLLATSSDYTIDFTTITKEALQSFEMPVEWSFAQAAVVHGLGGWFDLHFLPSSSTTLGLLSGGSISNAPPPIFKPDLKKEENMVDATAEELADPTSAPLSSTSTSVYGGMHASAASFQPSPLRAASLDAVISGFSVAPSTSYMTTSPYAAVTHWQQVRFLLSDPIAVNKGQRLVGKILFEANDQRSYDMHAELYVADASGAPCKNHSLKRSAFWKLDRQTYC